MDEWRTAATPIMLPPVKFDNEPNSIPNEAEVIRKGENACGYHERSSK